MGDRIELTHYYTVVLHKGGGGRDKQPMGMSWKKKGTLTEARWMDVLRLPTYSTYLL